MAIVANRTEKHSVEEILENFSDLESALYKLEQEDRLSFSMLDNKDRIIDVEFYYD